MLGPDIRLAAMFVQGLLIKDRMLWDAVQSPFDKHRTGDANFEETHEVSIGNL